mmetsp:Transcript_96265/g.269366  ORF Transcript_96265/g.269366 Transcript_96265/m.269366 type:complete len:216 (+) Transcript_96265:623-1270(+)
MKASRQTEHSGGRSSHVPWGSASRQGPERKAMYHSCNILEKRERSEGHREKTPPEAPSATTSPCNTPWAVAFPVSNILSRPVVQLISKRMSSNNCTCTCSRGPSDSPHSKKPLQKSSSWSTTSLIRMRPPKLACSTKPKYSELPPGKGKLSSDDLRSTTAPSVTSFPGGSAGAAARERSLRDDLGLAASSCATNSSRRLLHMAEPKWRSCGLERC